MTHDEYRAIDRTLNTLSRALDALNILESLHSCNDCNCMHFWEGDGEDCGYAPKWGEQVRYNCPHWKAREPKEGTWK